MNILSGSSSTNWYEKSVANDDGEDDAAGDGIESVSNNGKQRQSD